LQIELDELFIKRFRAFKSKIYILQSKIATSIESGFFTHPSIIVKGI